MIRVFFSDSEMGRSESPVQNWLNECKAQCVSNGPGWERTAHLVQVVAPTRGSSGWVAVFEIRDVAT